MGVRVLARGGPNRLQDSILSLKLKIDGPIDGFERDGGLHDFKGGIAMDGSPALFELLEVRLYLYQWSFSYVFTTQYAHINFKYFPCCIHRSYVCQ
jgi:hypothetical protein